MKNHVIALLILCLVVVLWPATSLAQRGGGSDSGATAVALLPTCNRTSGNCPRDYYMCRNSSDNNEIHYCTISGGWGTAGAGLIKQVTSVPSSCSTGEFIQNTSAVTGSQLYMCESGTYVQISGSGGGVTTLENLTDTSVTTPSSGELLIWDGTDWANKQMQTDATITSTGSVTIAADAVALGTDTTGNYVAGPTVQSDAPDRGIEMSGTEGATLGLRSDCDDGYGLVWTDGTSTWDCSTVSGGGGGSAITLDLGDTGANQSTDLVEIASINDTDGSTCSAANGSGCILREITADKLQIDFSQPWPAADALETNPPACTAGQYVTDLDADGTLTCATPADLAGVTQLVVTGDADEVQFTVNGKLSGQSSSVMEIYGDHDANGTLDAWFSLRDAAYTMNGPTIINNVYSQDASNVTLTVKGNTSQNGDILLVQSGGADDLLSVNETDGIVVADFGSTGGGIEIVDEASACDDPASGSTTICTIGGVPYVRDTGGSSTPIGASATHNACWTLYDVDGIDSSTTIASVWRAPANTTATEVWCESTHATSCTIQLQRDDGAAANMIDAASLTCTTTGATSTSFVTGEDDLDDGHTVDLQVVAGDTTNCTRISVCMEYTYD